MGAFHHYTHLSFVRINTNKGEMYVFFYWSINCDKPLAIKKSLPRTKNNAANSQLPDPVRQVAFRNSFIYPCLDWGYSVISNHRWLIRMKEDKSRDLRRGGKKREAAFRLLTHGRPLSLHRICIFGIPENDITHVLYYGIVIGEPLLLFNSYSVAKHRYYQ